jgi:Asp-tRNA(Asn)/Glu-tRNA(Gln) amidotransferase A subunit family amidase
VPRPVAEGLALSRTPVPERPADLEKVAFMPVTQLSQLVRSGRVSAVELTEMYLRRLERADAELHCVVTLTRERAVAQARVLDDELARGLWRGPLHGIPWGAKDLLAVRGYPTTWGAQPYRDRVVDGDATVVSRLDAAGAVLVAKLTLGALAMGDVWFGGQTCSPWDLREGSSGSSAGPAAAVAAGLVGFAIGTETRGSILSPCTQCGATGLRPTFGRVSRHGAMALSWSMDKIGPIARSVEDCAAVMAAIHGPDGRDESVQDVPFSWDGSRDLRGLRVGVLESAFDDARSVFYDTEWFDFNRATLRKLRAMGVELVPVELPDLPIGATSFILTAEAAAAFDELTRSNRDDEMVRQDAYAWPNTFRTARMVPAVEYLQANRVRRLAMREMARILDGIDVYVSPTYGGDNLLLTNLTGHPAVVVPNGFRKDGTPTSVTFCGNVFSDAEALLLAKAYQDATGFHLRRPPRFA